MKKEQLEKVQAEVSVWTYLQSLPPEKNNFKLKILMQEVADTFLIYSYENDDLKRKTTIYYHEETKEYNRNYYIKNKEKIKKIQADY